MATREAIIEALFNVLKASATFKTASRRNQDPEGLTPAETPALFLVEDSDSWDWIQSGYNNLAKRGMKLWVILYNSIDPSDVNTIPSSLINNALDSIEALFVPDDLINNTFTLGKLVQACYIDGETQRAPGDITGKALAVVPIRILLP